MRAQNIILHAKNKAQVDGEKRRRRFRNSSLSWEISVGPLGKSFLKLVSAPEWTSKAKVGANRLFSFMSVFFGDNHRCR